jgi:hypothetical protein
MLDQVAPKLRKLLLMLSSNKDGEVVNAARAIERTLRAANADWHDLTERLSAPRSPPPPPPPSASWEAKREFCLRHENLLRGREYAFVFGLGDWDGELTEKQGAWLNSIYARLKRGTRS